MKVRELIERLQEFDPESDVRIAQPTHDHWRSTVAAEIEDIEKVSVKHSTYHDADTMQEVEEEGEEVRFVIVLQ